MTKNEIKAALDHVGIKYGKKDNLATLQALHATAVEDGLLDAPVEEQEGETETPVEQPAPPAPAPATEGTGLKIEKDRPEQNGIKRPSIGGKCRAIWDSLDAYREETGELPTSKTVKELAADEGWNPNNASIEYYQWRKFHGISKQS